MRVVVAAEVGELRVLVEGLAAAVAEEVEVRPELEDVVATELHARAGQVVAEGEAVLLEPLAAGAAPRVQQPVVDLPRHVGVHGHLLPQVLLRGELGLVEPAVAGVAPVERPRVDLDGQGVGEAVRVLPADVAEVVVVAEVERGVDGAALALRVAQLGDAQVLAELLLLLPEKAAELRDERRGGLGRVAAEHDVGGVVAERAFVVEEVEQPVAHDRAAEVAAHLQAAVVGRGQVLLDRVGVLGGEAVADVVEEGVGDGLVGPAARVGEDDRARGALVLRLVVLREHAELLDRPLRERVPLARVLPRDAAREHVTLVRRAVDEDVDRGGGLTAGRERLVGAVDVARGQVDARDELGQVEDVALEVGQVGDLLARDAPADLGGARGLRRRARRRHLHRRELHRRLARREVDVARLRDPHVDLPRLRREPDAAHADFVSSWP